ncbi:MAG: alpha/beta hydrolase [Myxococcota bacterium]
MGNKDGLPRNEAARAGTVKGSAFDRNPLANKLRSALEPGWSTADEEQRLDGFISAQEKIWGRPVTDLASGSVSQFDRLRAEKAVALVRFGRTPADVSEGLIEAKGKVDGQPIEARQVFWQRWKPIGPFSGKVVVLSPGFLQTGRNFYEQIQLLNRAGHEVVVMDHQWAGHGSGKKGGIDRGFGIARDVAAVTAFAQQVADREHAEKPHELVLLGTSMGGGAGALGAIALNDAGKIELEGSQMPKGLSAVLQAPYFSRTRNLVNDVLAGVGRLPVAKDIPLPAMGLPILTGDQTTAAKLAEHAVIDDITGRAQAFHASDADLASIRALLEQGKKPQGRFFFIHAENDTLADVESSRAVAGLFNERAHFRTLPSANHVFEETAREQELVLEGIEWATRRN